MQEETFVDSLICPYCGYVDNDSGELCATLGHQWHEGTSYGEGTDIARQIDCVWCKKVKKQVIKRQPATFWEDQP